MRTSDVAASIIIDAGASIRSELGFTLICGVYFRPRNNILRRNRASELFAGNYADWRGDDSSIISHARRNGG